MTLIGLEPRNPVFEGAKTFHVLDRAVTAIGSQVILVYSRKFWKNALRD
jgi:hypothetical protein